MNRRLLLKLLAAGSVAHLYSLRQAIAATRNGRRLVLVELAGANDGLNTLVPISNDHYHKYRPNIGLRNADVTRLNDDFAVHNSLQALMTNWDQGDMAWAHGLGYPSPNRSHFKSMGLWETGGDGNREGRQGWLTHDIEHRLGPVTDPHGISLTADMNIFTSNSGRWLSMTSPEQFLVQRKQSTIKTSFNNDSMELVTRRMAELDHSLAELSNKLDKTPQAKRFPGGDLGAQLQQVTRLIRAGVDTPVYRVQLSGFDTHENQLYRHSTLLTTLAQALNAFTEELKADGEWNNTLIMTYSEFGRRTAENSSNGTDHGTAAPHFVLGGKVNGGLYGSPTDLANIDEDGDPAHTMDYRALYSQVLSHWFEIDNNSFASYADKRLQDIFS